MVLNTLIMSRQEHTLPLPRLSVSDLSHSSCNRRCRVQSLVSRVMVGSKTFPWVCPRQSTSERELFSASLYNTDEPHKGICQSTLKLLIGHSRDVHK